MSSIKRKGGERTYVPTCSLSPRKMTLMNAAVVMLKGLNMATNACVYTESYYISAYSLQRKKKNIEIAVRVIRKYFGLVSKLLLLTE